MDWINSQPFVIAALFLTAVAAVRSQLTYLLGRGIRAGVVRVAWATTMAQDKQPKAVASLQKWGWPLIPLSFLTVGFQTAVQLTAGLVGWRYLPYTLASIPGWILWGVVYAAGGLAAFAGILALWHQSWWLVLLAIVVVTGIIITIVKVRNRVRYASTDVAPVKVS